MGEGLRGMYIYLDVLDEVTFILSKIASCMGKQCHTGGPLFVKYGYVDTFPKHPTVNRMSPSLRHM